MKRWETGPPTRYSAGDWAAVLSVNDNGSGSGADLIRDALHGDNRGHKPAFTSGPSRLELWQGWLGMSGPNVAALFLRDLLAGCSRHGHGASFAGAISFLSQQNQWLKTVPVSGGAAKNARVRVHRVDAKRV